MKPLKIEFFHDVICSFCYPMSNRMREIVKENPDLEVIHRSFALAPDAQSHAMQFGSHEGAKDQIISHWQAANRNDNLNRFNIEGMRQADILFPTSIAPLRAAKAAQNQDKYWDVFDKLQEGLFTRNLKVDEDDVIFSLIKEVDIDFEAWLKDYQSEDSLNQVYSDLALADTYGISSVPSLVINGQYLINGAQPKEVVVNLLKQIQAKDQLVDLSDQSGQACDIDGNCN